MKIGRARAGMALVITLIMLAVTLVMAVAFLAIARRERNAVTTTTDTATARLATDVALAAAQAQVAANILTTTNLGAFDFNLLVSTNYLNAAGFAGGSSNPTNVNYDYYNDAAHSPTFATLADRNLNIANLYLLPRAPVFIRNPNNGLTDFRFWLDVNRNGKFEANGWVTNLDNLGNAILDANGSPLIFEVGDPEWVGVLERPDQPHGPNNHFVARYAFLAQPIGNSLDLNFIHNQAATLKVNLPNGSLPGGYGDGFIRNQGVGSWELNLASFLADLNTNVWGQVIGAPSLFYQYNQAGSSANAGYAFEDARAVLSWRYNFNYGSLFTANQSLNFNAANVFPYDTIDAYGDGSLQTTVDTNADFPLLTAGGDNNSAAWSWAGSDNTNRFFSILSDVFGGNNFLGNFPAHLQGTGYGTSTYDRYTLYRLLDQLGTDSTADDGKLNLNYSNAVVQYDGNGMATNIAIVNGAETNLVPWAATNFFHAAADRLLRHYTANWLAANRGDYTNTYGTTITQAFGITNIPVYVNGQFVYTPAVNRLLQLAANIYDASTNRALTLPHDYPSVFRPLFSRDAGGLGTNVYISGFTILASASGPDTVAGPDDPQLAPPTDILVLALTNGVVNNLAVNVYGVPWIIGAKKGFPNFNNFTVANSVGLTRRLRLLRDTNNPSSITVTGTNQMYVMTVSDGVGYDFWNSYNSNYNGTIYGQVRLNLSVVITNDEGFTSKPMVYMNPYDFAYNPLAFVTNNWPGSAAARGYTWPNSRSFITNSFPVPFMSYMAYRTPTAPAPTYNPPGFLASPFNYTVNSTVTPPGFISTNYFTTNSLSQNFEVNNANLNTPHFGELVTNRLQVYLLDYTNGVYRVVDYAHFKQDYTRDLTKDIFTDDSGANNNVGVWNTNIDTATGVPYGVENQIHISLGNLAPPGPPPTEDGAWNGDPDAGLLGNTPPQQQASFQAFMLGGKWTATKTVAAWGTYLGATSSNHLSHTAAPYSPTRYVVNYTTWQANDPLVHYLASDMVPSADLGVTTKYNMTPPAGSLMSAVTIGQLNKNYQPWGGYLGSSPTPSETSFFTETETNLMLKDPLAWGSDNWDFPGTQYPALGWLGRVHRGTPWQTVYLKAHNILHMTDNLGNNIGTNLWTQWTGDTAQTVFGHYFDAVNSGPLQDRQLFDLFTTRFNDNSAHGTLPVNQTHLAAWSAVFGGMVVLSNSTVNPTASVRPVTTYFTIDPAGVIGSSSPLGQIVNSINSARSVYTNSDGLVGTFEHIGDVLSAPSLTEQSPFLNSADPTQAKYGISDEIYEWLPQQALGLLRAGSTPRYVIYCYGQTLRPAANSLVTTGGNDFGLCTNYQITAESAARAVIRVERHVTATGTNYSTVVESFNPLPPN